MAYICEEAQSMADRELVHHQVLTRSAAVHGYVGCNQVSVQGHVVPSLQEAD